MSKENKSPVTLEALLRVKRIEQPAPEFWVQFDNELRAKQLAAIVEKRPWWHAFPRVYGSFSRHRLALGGVAALAITLFTFKEYQGGNAPLAASRDVTAFAPAAAVVTPAEPAPAVAAVVPAPVRSVVAVSSPVLPAPASGQEATAMVMSPMPERLLGSVVSARDAMLQIERNQNSDDVPSARAIAAGNLEAVQAAEPGLIRNTLGLSQGFQAPLVAEHAPITEPLAQMTPPSEERRSRLLTEALPQMAVYQNAPEPSSEHAVSDLSDDRLYESISRYGVSGDHLSIKF